MKVQKILVLSSLLAVTLALGACGTDQDPLARRTKELRDADKPGEKPDRTPIDSRNMVIDTPNLVTFVEGKADDFTVGVRVLIPGYDLVDVVVDNMADFEGATFDPVSGMFAWTPPLGTVIEGFDREIKLNFTVQVTSSDNNKNGVMTKTQSVIVRIDKKPFVPVVSIVKAPSEAVREMDRVEFVISVSDEDRTGPSGRAPRLVFMETSSAAISIGQVMRVSAPSYNAVKGTWLFNCSAYLRGEYTPGQSTIGFDVEAISAFGRISLPVGYTNTIYTSLKVPLYTWGKVGPLASGEKVVIPFVVYNPQGEGLLTLDLKSVAIPDGSSLQCTAGNQTSVLNCKFTVTPVGLPDRITDSKIFFTVITKNVAASRDTLVIKSNISLTYTTNKAGPL